MVCAKVVAAELGPEYPLPELLAAVLPIVLLPQTPALLVETSAVASVDVVVVAVYTPEDVPAESTLTPPPVEVVPSICTLTPFPVEFPL